MNVAFVSSEVVPFAKTGGLADVAGTLPKALAEDGLNVKVFTPKYNIIDEEKYSLQHLWNIGEIPVRVAGHTRSVHLYKSTLPGSEVEIYFIECQHYFDRSQLYTNDPDEDERFILFAKGFIETLQRLQWKPDIIHCNDWQTGLIPLYIKDNYNWDKLFDETATVFTIHNIGYQGKFNRDTRFKAEIAGKYFYPMGPVEYYGDISFMKTGISFSEVINTVSKTYAKEILTPEFGSGMESVLKERKDDLYGILNGVDYDHWDPEKDELIPYQYSIKDLSGKIKNKKHLLDKFNLPFKENAPLIGIVSRLAIQKGFDILSSVIYDLMELDAKWIILGSGETKYEELFQSLSKKFKDKVGCYIGFNNELAHLIEAGSNMFLMPSHYEPCGLNQIYSLKYGTVPVVRKTGGLADTVDDWHENLDNGKETGTGFSFSDYSAGDLKKTINRAINLFYNDKDSWKKIQKNGMQKDFSWERSAKEYHDLYNEALNKKTN